MALVHENLSGYLDDDYLSGAYLAGTLGAHLPAQFEVKIVNAEKDTNSQFEAKIVDFEKDTNAQFESKIEDQKDLNAQFESKIVDFQKDLNSQFESRIDQTKTTNAQFGVSNNVDKSLNAQFEARIVDFQKDLHAQFEPLVVASKVMPSQFIKTGIVHRICEGYLTGPYLDYSYLSARLCASLHSQFNVQIQAQKDLNAQFESLIVDHPRDLNAQFESRILDFTRDLNAQYQVSIIDFLNAQYQVVIYNTTATRILCDFLSRGLSVAQGGTGGQNWTAKIGAVDITKPGDFSPSNLNTDIVEQRWESTAGSVSNVNLDCDTEIAQGITIDTLAILDHNISPGGTLVLQGADDAAFSTINTTISIPIAETNIYYIAPTFPTALDQNRYWRFNINDPLNSDNFLRIGTIVFGNSIILSEAGCLTDKIKRTNTHFVDKVRTEGFTSVSNDRAFKRRVEMRFQDIKFGLGDFEKLDGIFSTARTSLKCLWIPVPQTPERFAAFAKIVQIPLEEHNVKSRTDHDLDLITFNLSIDESL